MKEYEIVKEVYNACAGDNFRERCDIFEEELADPMAYVQEQYKLESGMQYVTGEKNGSVVIEALYPSGIKHRYTFTEF